MVDNVEIAHSLGKLRMPDGSVVRPQDIRTFDPQKLVVLASGTQAEPMSALSRIAVDNHRLMSIAENDTVILSSRIIPGNEKAIFRMIDHFFRRRVLVYYEGGRSAPIHVSGHASQEEMKILLQLVRPKYFIPDSRGIPAAFPPFGAGGAIGRGAAARYFCWKAASPSNSPRMAARIAASR